MNGLDTIAEIYFLMDIYGTYGWSDTSQKELMESHGKLLAGQIQTEDLLRQQEALFTRIARKTFQAPSNYLVDILRIGLSQKGLAKEVTCRVLEDEDTCDETMISIEYALTPKGLSLAERLDSFKDRKPSELVKLYEKGRN